MSEDISNLVHVIQYRRRDSALWTSMAAFDVAGAAEDYYKSIGRHDDLTWPFEYRLIEIKED